MSSDSLNQINQGPDTLSKDGASGVTVPAGSDCQPSHLAHPSPCVLLDNIKAEACRLGFSACGASPADAVRSDHALAFTRWLEDGRNAGMDYMGRYMDLRLDPRLLMPGARSVISVALSYYPRQTLRPDQYQFAYYAYGKDYHDVVRHKLQQLVSAVLPDAACRICVDTAPILERYWAVQSGLGWIGRNKTLNVPQVGSFVFLGEIVTSAQLDHYDSPIVSGCGHCRLCVGACPSGALCEDSSVNTCDSSPADGQTADSTAFFHSTMLDARRCLSCQTIEHKGDFSDEIAVYVKNQQHPKYIYGCDRCQLVCPHNRGARPTTVDEFVPEASFMNMKPEDWHHLTPEQFQSLFRGSAVKRVKYEGLIRNIRYCRS